MISTGLDESIVVHNIKRVLDELEQFDRDFVKPPVGAALQAATPLRRWIDALPERLDPQLHAARALGRQAATMRPPVLVIDDDKFMRKLLLRLLSTSGYDTEAADSAAQAVIFLRARQPGLILMDVRLPDVDGIELTRQLKSLDAYAGIPIIMLTGQGRRQILADSRQAGAADFIVKPFDRETLRKKVSTHLSMPASPP